MIALTRKAGERDGRRESDKIRESVGVGGRAKGSFISRFHDFPISRLLDFPISRSHDLTDFLNLLRRCFECGQPLGKKDVFCPRCGAKQPREPKQQMDRINRIYEIQNRKPALLLL